jgi:hypothetical protein
LARLSDPGLDAVAQNVALELGEDREHAGQSASNGGGQIRDRSFENQRNRASGLNLVTAAIVLWNTVYLERAIAALSRDRPIDDALIASVAPLGWNHINLTGDYRWQGDKRVAKGQFRGSVAKILAALTLLYTQARHVALQHDSLGYNLRLAV